MPLRDIAPVGEFEPGSPERNESNAEVGKETVETVHSLVDVFPGHGKHVEKFVSDSALPESVSRCDDRAVLQDGSNRAEVSLHTDATKSPAPIVFRPTRPRKPVDRYGFVP